MSPARQFGTIRRLPSGRYQARYWHLGEQVSAGTTFASKTEARAWLSSVERPDQRRRSLGCCSSRARRGLIEKLA